MTMLRGMPWIVDSLASSLTTNGAETYVTMGFLLSQDQQFGQHYVNCITMNADRECQPRGHRRETIAALLTTPSSSHAC